MSDDFDRLGEALKAARTAPDPVRRAENMARALENYDRLQETAAAARPNRDRPQGAGFLQGVRTMFARLTGRPALAATASVAALGLGVVVVTQLPPGVRAPVAPPPVAGAVAPAADKQVAPPAAPTAPAAPAAPAASAPIGALTGPLRQPAPFAVVPPAVPPAARPQAQVGGRVAGGAASDAAGGVLGEVAPQTLPAPASPARAKRAADTPWLTPAPNTEAFANAAQNPVKVTAEDPVSTFSVDIDTASYAIVRASLRAGALPPPDAVRVEEMVNYFPYAYPAPAPGGAPFRPSVSVMATPWNAGTRLVTIGLQGALPAVADRPPLNLVFLIDTSGSMQSPDKLPLLKRSFKLMLGQLRPEDRIAIVAYAGSAGEVLAPTAAADKATILAALDRLQAGGSTAGQAGLQQAYQVAGAMARDGAEVPPTG